MSGSRPTVYGKYFFGKGPKWPEIRGFDSLDPQAQALVIAMRFASPMYAYDVIGGVMNHAFKQRGHQEEYKDVKPLVDLESWVLHFYRLFTGYYVDLHFKVDEKTGSISIFLAYAEEETVLVVNSLYPQRSSMYKNEDPVAYVNSKKCKVIKASDFWAAMGVTKQLNLIYGRPLVKDPNSQERPEEFDIYWNSVLHNVLGERISAHDPITSEFIQILDDVRITPNQDPYASNFSPMGGLAIPLNHQKQSWAAGGVEQAIQGIHASEIPAIKSEIFSTLSKIMDQVAGEPLEVRMKILMMLVRGNLPLTRLSRGDRRKAKRARLSNQDEEGIKTVAATYGPNQKRATR